MNKKRLVVFDFDRTLVNTPEDTSENRELVRDKTGYDGHGWWGRPESIDIDIFEIPTMDWVVDEYYKHWNDDDSFVIMMTGRIPRCSENVMRILKLHKLDFDKHHFTYGKRTLEFKLDRLNEYVEKGTNLEEVVIYDDRTSHIPKFRKWGDETEDNHNIKVRLYHVVGDFGYNTYELKKGEKLR